MESRVGIATGRRLSGRATRYQRKSPRWTRSGLLVAFSVAEPLRGDGLTRRARPMLPLFLLELSGRGDGQANKNCAGGVFL